MFSCISKFKKIFLISFFLTPFISWKVSLIIIYILLKNLCSFLIEKYKKKWKCFKKMKRCDFMKVCYHHDLYHLIYVSMYCMDVNDSTISDRLYICRHRIDKLLPKYCVSVRRNFDSWYLLRFLCLQYGTEERKHISWCYFYSGMDIRVVRRPDFLFVCCSFASLSHSYFY